MRKGRLVLPSEGSFMKVAIACFVIQFIFRCLYVNISGGIGVNIPFIGSTISYISVFSGTDYAVIILPLLLHDLLALAFYVLNFIGILKARNSLTILAWSWFVLAATPIIILVLTFVAVGALGFGGLMSVFTTMNMSDNGVLMVMSVICCALTGVLLILIDRGSYKNKYVPALCVLAVFLLNYALPLIMFIWAGYFFIFILNLIGVLSAFLPTAIILLSMYNLYTPIEVSPETEQRLNPYMPPEPYEQEVTLPEENNDLGE